MTDDLLNRECLRHDVSPRRPIVPLRTRAPSIRTPLTHALKSEAITLSAQASSSVLSSPCSCSHSRTAASPSSTRIARSAAALSHADRLTPCGAAALVARSATDSSREIDSFFTATNVTVALHSDPTDIGVTPAGDDVDADLDNEEAESAVESGALKKGVGPFAVTRRNYSRSSVLMAASGSVGIGKRCSYRNRPNSSIRLMGSVGRSSVFSAGAYR